MASSPRPPVGTARACALHPSRRACWAGGGCTACVEREPSGGQKMWRPVRPRALAPLPRLGLPGRDPQGPRLSPPGSSRLAGTHRALGGARHSPQAACPRVPASAPRPCGGDVGPSPPHAAAPLLRGCFLVRESCLRGGSPKPPSPRGTTLSSLKDAPPQGDALSRGGCLAPFASACPVSASDPSPLQALP